MRCLQVRIQRLARQMYREKKRSAHRGDERYGHLAMHFHGRAVIPSGQMKAQFQRYCWLALAAVVLVMLFLPFYHVKTPGAEVSAWLTTADGANKLTSQPLIYFSAERSSFLTTFDIDEQQKMQQIDGF